ncbi:hypothetical protein [Helicobacter aurati]|nr:hypothetical protein [Helicobacter aurati]
MINKLVILSVAKNLIHFVMSEVLQSTTEESQKDSKRDTSHSFSMTNKKNNGNKNLSCLRALCPKNPMKCLSLWECASQDFVRATCYRSRIEQALAQSARILPTLANMTKKNA